MDLGNSFSRSSKAYPSEIIPVWLEVKERKTAGCTIDTENLPVGSIIRAGSPIYMKKMGDKGVILDAYEVVSAVTASGTSVTLKQGICGTVGYTGLVVGKIGSDGSITTAGALGATNDGMTFAITANALGALAAGDKLYVAVEAGSSKALQMPTGLSWHDVYVTEGMFGASEAVVTKGQLLADRAPELLDAYKASLGDTGITFEYEL